MGLHESADACQKVYVLNLRIGVNNQPEDAISTGMQAAPRYPVPWQLQLLLQASDIIPFADLYVVLIRHGNTLTLL